MNKILYFDMDGVLVDFDTLLLDVSMKYFPDNSREEIAEFMSENVQKDSPSMKTKFHEIVAENHEYLTIHSKPIKCVCTLIDDISEHVTVGILSSASNKQYEVISNLKYKWLETHLKSFDRLDKNEIVFVDSAKLKSNYANSNTYLIDDYRKNTDRFKEYGGHAFHLYRNDNLIINEILRWLSNHKLLRG